MLFDSSCSTDFIYIRVERTRTEKEEETIEEKMSMQTDENLKKIKPGPYPRPIRLTVVSVGIPHTYGEEKRLMNIALADNTDAIKAVCFDSTKFNMFKEDSGVVLRNIIMKTDEIVITKQSSVFKCQTVDIREEIRVRGKNIISPPLPELISIADAKKSPQKERLRVIGRVTNDGLRTTRNIRNTEVPLRSITLSDSKDSVRVSLWRDMADVDIKPGDHVEISHVVVNHYMSEVQLRTTHLTKIKKVEAPLQSREVEFLGLVRGDISSELMSMEDGDFNIANTILDHHFSCEAHELEGKFPCFLNIKCQDKVIVAIENEKQ